MRVSVIIPTYNYAHFLSECIDSVLAQTVLPDEIIIVDDGSTDNTPEIIRPYLSHSLIKYIRTENSGVSTARNTAIMEASGDLIGILDSDDKWRSDKLELQLPLFENDKVGVVYSLSQRFDENGPVEGFRQVTPQRGQILDALMSNNIVPLSSAMVRRKCLIKVGMFNEKYSISADYDLWIRLSIQGCEFDYVNLPLMMYRTGHSSMISDVRMQNREYYAILKEVFNGFGKESCTAGMKRTAWATFYAECACGHSEQNNRWRAFVDSIRSIYHRPTGVLNGMAWRVLVKSLLPKKVVSILRPKAAQE